LAAVLKVTEDIRLNFMEDGQVTVLVLLDFSQAFDMVNHRLLLCKLKNVQNYSNEAQMLVDSHLNSRTQFERCEEKESSVGRVKYSVPQGSVLGPFSFVSYIDGVSMVIKYSRFHIYADSLQIYHSFSVSDLQRCYDEINLDCSTANGLRLNLDKSQVIILIH
jgi:hypothetical protein